MDEGFVSRSQKKRDVREIDQLGVRMIELPADWLGPANLPQELDDALIAARSMQRNALRRQKLYIGRLLRGLSEEHLTAVFELVEATSRAGRQQAEEFRQLERWRTRLIAGGDAAIDELIAARGQGDRQRLQQLVRAARRESDEKRPPASSRKLFRALRELFESEPPEDPPEEPPEEDAG